MEEERPKIQRPYPRTVTLEDDTTLNMRLMAPGDMNRIVAFARSLPADDLLFLRMDITKAIRRDALGAEHQNWANGNRAGGKKQRDRGIR